MKVSVWLMPPGNARIPLKAQIDEFAQLPGASVPFEPHITVCGGIQCESILEARQLAEKLQQSLGGFGRVHCHVQDKAQGHADSWNQALYLPVTTSDDFILLCQKTRQILGMNSVQWNFSPPACQPHSSLFYGDQCSVPEEKRRETKGCSFLADRIALWKTDPSTVEGVAEWEELAVVDLC